MIAATQMRVGMVIMHDGKPYRVAHMIHRTPGNLRGFVQATLVSIVSGSKTDHRFSSEDKVERASLEQHKLQFSYRAGDEFHFMNTETFEMMSLDKDVLGDSVGYLVEGMVIEASYFEGRVVGVDLPTFVELTVQDTTPNIKGSTAAASPKPATLETGIEVRVPQYILTGDRVKIDTRTGEFIERVSG